MVEGRVDVNGWRGHWIVCRQRHLEVEHSLLPFCAGRPLEITVEIVDRVGEWLSGHTLDQVLVVLKLLKVLLNTSSRVRLVNLDELGSQQGSLHLPSSSVCEAAASSH